MINIAVEGPLDEEAAKAVVAAAGHEIGKVYPAGGRTELDPKVPNYCRAAAYGGPGWVVFRDSDGHCPVELRGKLLSNADVPEGSFDLRIACTMIEAWLMADARGFSDFFQVRVGEIPQDPDSLDHAKQSLLSLVKRFGKGSIQDDVVTKDGQTGPLYTHRLNEFARDHWNVEAAMENSPGLERAVRRLGELRAD
ncbi:MAG: hypothetical protein ACTH0P_11790 [Candidatus Corynebacterium faecigallinarum]